MRIPSVIPSLALVLWLLAGTSLRAADQVVTDAGIVEGTPAGDVRSFKGIPYAAPPVGDLRWSEPRPVPHWEGVRKADAFGPRAMQRPVFGDLGFRSAGMSEDCLYLNVWTPARSGEEKLPVLVYFYGGGFVAGDGSERRYDGASMAARGIVSVTLNYRLGVFGFLAHPELTRESPHHASGNYGLLDQQAALAWVQRNIGAFGGDPRRVTVAGESAGSISVSAQMASPLSKGWMAGAIGESGSVLGTLRAVPLADAEALGVRFAAGLGQGEAPPLAALRAIPAAQLLDDAGKPGQPMFPAAVDGYFLPKPPLDIYLAGEQAHVPLLAGVNSGEAGYEALLKHETPTVDHYRQALRRLFPADAEEALKHYPAANEAEVMNAARELASDLFISYGTWKWVDLSSKGGAPPTYYYLYDHPRPDQRADAATRARGASHAVEIEYALGNLDLVRGHASAADDYRASQLLQSYFARFIKTGDPNVPGQPEWPRFSSGRRLVVDVDPHAESTDGLRARYEFLDSVFTKK